ncbi:MAG: hypothetical protein KJ795_04985 [Gammaproteobacteria bacterium]|nr:hypothetical protein [Gammaproteobacteria bacterium]MBU1777385.1 hypothetical protein [Gammaproteobacteria bacterium]MBU1969380.1 hypothetical protein [Gammaproteobacteria bacterium]
MLFQPAIIALLLASAVSVLMLLAATPYAWQLVRRWDIASGSELQLVLERRTYLMSTLLSFVFATQLVALLLFVFNADKMAVMFVGAMCAVGTLNANAYGFPALISQIAVFFMAAVWLVLNHVDSRAYDYPLVRVKYRLLMGILPFVVLAFALQLIYFLNLKADVITSCCGSLFSSDAQTLVADASALPPQQGLWLFYTALLTVIAVAVQHARKLRAAYVVAAASAAAFVAALTGILSFVSLYVYEHPHHHCPFCLLKPEYDYQGYWLYLPLFVATAAGLGVGAIQPFARVPSLAAVVPQMSRRLAWIAALGFAFFTAVATYMVADSNLILLKD